MMRRNEISRVADALQDIVNQLRQCAALLGDETGGKNGKSGDDKTGAAELRNVQKGNSSRLQT